MNNENSLLSLLKLAYRGNKDLGIYKKQIILDRKTIVSIFAQSGWKSKTTNKSYSIGSICLYLQCQRGNISRYSDQLKEYQLQSIQQFDKNDLKQYFLSKSIEKQQQQIKYKQIQETNHSKTNQKQQNFIQNQEQRKQLLQKMQIETIDTIKTSQNQKNKDFLSKQSSNKVQSKNNAWLQNIKDYSSSYNKVGNKRNQIQQVFYQQGKSISQQDFYGQFYKNYTFSSYKNHKQKIQVIKFINQIQKPFTNQKKCLQMQKNNLTQFFNFQKPDSGINLNTKNRYTTIIQKYKRPIIIVPHENHFNGNIYLANFQKFAIHGQYIENATSLATSIQKKYELSYMLKQKPIIFQIISIKQFFEAKNEKDDKISSKSIKQQSNLQKKQSKLLKQTRQLKQVIDWSLVVGIVIQGKKQQYQYFDNIIKCNISLSKIKPIQINYDKPFQKSTPLDNIRHIILDKVLRYKDLQAQKQFWQEIQNYLFDIL